MKIHQHVKFQANPSMHSLANARKPLRTEGRTCRKTVTYGWSGGPTDPYTGQKRVFQASDGRTDGQPENIMPPAPKGGGITTLLDEFPSCQDIFLTLNMLICFKNYKRCINISYHILVFFQQMMTKFAMEQPYMLPILYWQYHACWCWPYGDLMYWPPNHNTR